MLARVPRRAALCAGLAAGLRSGAQLAAAAACKQRLPPYSPSVAPRAGRLQPGAGVRVQWLHLQPQHRHLHGHHPQVLSPAGGQRALHHSYKLRKHHQLLHRDDCVPRNLPGGCHVREGKPKLLCALLGWVGMNGFGGAAAAQRHYIPAARHHHQHFLAGACTNAQGMERLCSCELRSRWPPRLLPAAQEGQPAGMLIQQRVPVCTLLQQRVSGVPLAVLLNHGRVRQLCLRRRGMQGACTVAGMQSILPCVWWRWRWCGGVMSCAALHSYCI